MTSGNDLINRNWKQAECTFYEAGTGAALEVAIASLLTLQYWATIGAAAGGLAFQYAAGLAGCYDNPEQPTQGTGDCTEVDGCGTVWAEVQGGGWLPLPTGSNVNEARKVNSVVMRYGYGHCKAYQWHVMVDAVACDGSPTDAIFCADYDYTGRWELRPNEGSSCVGNQPGPLPPGAIGQPTTVEDGDCNWTFTPKDSYIDASGAVRVYYVVEADNDACGGPFAYWSGPDGPTPVNPNPPDGGPDPIPPPEPCPCPPGGGDDGGGSSGGPYQLPEQLYKLTGICETVPEGQEQPEYEYPIPANRYELALAARLDVIAAMLQQHLALKTPTCQPEIQPLEGDYRTISFISDEYSPEGRNRLRKRFRYRSSSGIGLSGVVEHWRSFTWQAGAVIVTHTGSNLGAPKVWAATAEEGKRVIRHAAAEAGVDADQVGRWIVSGSTDPRYGMPGTMRVNTKGGYYWITSRLGPDERPLVQAT